VKCAGNGGLVAGFLAHPCGTDFAKSTVSEPPERTKPVAPVSAMPRDRSRVVGDGSFDGAVVSLRDLQPRVVREGTQLRV
jgi:hypothetical protein